MTVISSTGVLYWDMYFILKLLPVAMVWVTVDVTEGTRDYKVIKTMEHYKHLQIAELPGIVTEIAATAKGVKFYQYLVRIGYGAIVTEEDGRKQIRLNNLMTNTKIT